MRSARASRLYAKIRLSPLPHDKLYVRESECEEDWVVSDLALELHNTTNTRARHPEW